MFDATIEPTTFLPVRKCDEVIVLLDEVGFTTGQRLVVVHPSGETFVMPWQRFSDGCKGLAASDEFIYHISEQFL